MSARTRNFLIIIALVALTCAAMGRVVRNDFLNWDDRQMLVENPLVGHLTGHNLAAIWRGPILKLYTPLAFTVWAVVAKIFGVNPTVFHGLNLSVHLVCVVLVFAILRRILITWRPTSENATNDLAAFLGAAIFAVHPLQVEAVAWVSGFNNLLAGMFGLGAIYFYLIDRQEKDSSLAGSPYHGKYVSATVLLVLAMLSKPTAVVVPLVVMVIHRLVFRGSWKEILRWVGPWVLIAVVFAGIASHVQPAATVKAPGLWARPIIAGDAVGFYLGKILVPLNLNVDYGRTPSGVGEHWLIGAMVVVALLALWISGLRRSVLGIGIAVLVVALLPVLGLRAFDFQRYSTVADRYVYLGMLGVSIFAAVIARRWRFPVALIVLALAVMSARQKSWWRDTETLFNHTLALNPQSFAAHKALGFVAASANRIDEAEMHYAAALELQPEDGEVHYDLANLLNLNMNDPARSLAHYRAAIADRPNDARIELNYGVALVKLRDLSGAENAYRRALEIDPNYPEAHANLGWLYELRGQIAEAREQYRQALGVDPQCGLALRGLQRIGPR